MIVINTNCGFLQAKERWPEALRLPHLLCICECYDLNVILNYSSLTCYFAYRVRASQDQMKALVNYATFRFRPWWCPGAVGSPCLVNSQCNPPGICSWFRCVLCNQDTQCAANQYCKGRFNPFIVNHCSARKPNGQLCTRDAMCISGKRKLTRPNIFDQESHLESKPSITLGNII